MPLKSSNRRARPFWITLICISALTLTSLLAHSAVGHRSGDHDGVAERRVLEGLGEAQLLKRDLACRLVHHAEDKCAFIKANCPDEEAGILSYLSLYYCHLEKAQPVAFIILAVWLALLFTTIGIAASDFFCINLSTIASIFGMSESMAGVTFLAFGNGSPDVFSTFAAMNSHSGSLAVGELIGAAGFITAVVAGSMALVREFKVGKKTFLRDVGFFVVAASFSMIFMADGTLYLWECCAMIGFYLFYVVIVVVWHWCLGRRRKRRQREAAARGHYLSVANEEIEVTEEDEDDEDAPANARPYRDVGDFGALELSSTLANEPEITSVADSDGARARQLAAEMATSMRVTRPRGVRKNTITPVRPSLVGALEFRSALSSLQRSRGSASCLSDLPRYSDEPTQGSGPRTDFDIPSSYMSTPLIVSDEPREHGQIESASGRTRAVSMNDVEGYKPQNPAAYTAAKIPDIELVPATPTFPRASDTAAIPEPNTGLIPLSPTISLSPPVSTDVSRSVSPSPSHERRKYTNSLAPPEESFSGVEYLRADFLRYTDGTKDSSDNFSAQRGPERPRLKIPPSPMKDTSKSKGSQSPILQFPEYTESPLPMSSHGPKTPSLPSLKLSDPLLPPESVRTNPDLSDQERPISWWPYNILSSPYSLLSTLFPTLFTWRDKSIWDKFVSIVSAPSIFLLAITLPVVEADSQDDADLDEGIVKPPAGSGSSAGPTLVPESPPAEAGVSPEWFRYRRSTESHSTPRSPEPRYSGHNNAAVAVSVENLHHNPHSLPIPAKQQSVGQLSEAPPISPRDWNRWLVAVQSFTAPLFVVLIVWANNYEDLTGFPISWVLISLLCSLIASTTLMVTTTPSEPPKYRSLFCFLGFVVSIAWISTIAGEVVGVLKAFGVILGISDAILGLTVFAVGNSLGDLVADITVARLGYPVMALSACFGGPMLNILLGIGISGMYMTIKEANSKHAHHPSKEIRYRPYQVEVGGTLMISGITLLVTLVGLLIVVPLNNWVMSRRIGWGLIILWSVSTVVNLAVEVSGVWDDTASAIVS